jgi:hypothetical protein
MIKKVVIRSIINGVFTSLILNLMGLDINNISWWMGNLLFNGFLCIIEYIFDDPLIW